MPRGQEQITPSPGATVQLWLQSPLSSEHRSVRQKIELLLNLLIHNLRCRSLTCCYGIPCNETQPGSCCLLPQSFSSEPSGQSSVPSQSFSAGRQMVESLAHTWWESLHTSASQLSSSELSSQSLSPSHTQALLIQRATGRRQAYLKKILTNFSWIVFKLWSSYQSPYSQTWQLGRTCVWRPHSSSRRSGPCSRCPRRSAIAAGCTGRPSDTETHLYDNLQGDAWLWRGRCHKALKCYCLQPLAVLIKSGYIAWSRDNAETNKQTKLMSCLLDIWMATRLSNGKD